MSNNALIYLSVVFILLSCSDEKKKNENNPSTDLIIENTPKQTYQDEEDTSVETGDYDEMDGEELFNVDLTQSLENKSLAELRLLRNSFFAKQGYLFSSAELRSYFLSFSWYSDLMYERWEKEDPEPIRFTEEEQQFIDKIKEKEKELLERNYVSIDNKKTINVNNIINNYQFEGLEDDFLQHLSKNGFVITPNQNIQLFHLYEQNDYKVIPNFVTTDLFLQLYHMYFSYLLRNLEEDIFYDRMLKFSHSQLDLAISDFKSTNDPTIKRAAKFVSIFYEVAIRILDNKQNDLPDEINTVVEYEIDKIENTKDATSEYLGYSTIKFPYSLFKPRGHYTRSDKLKNYFKAMMWLQKAEMCIDDTESFEHGIYMAQLMRKGNIDNSSAMQLFESVYEPIKYIIGEPDNISVYDIASNSLLLNNELSAIDTSELKKQLLSLGRNKIKPKAMLSCNHKLNLFPQRYIFDNEVIQDLVDTESKPTKRGFPKGIDVFGVLGVREAQELLTDFYGEEENWQAYKKNFEQLQAKSKTRDKSTVYAKWVECLLEMQKPKKEDYPFFMIQDSWRKKELNTALASWAELKHDAILYAEQPFGAECGDGGPPEPVTVGYVEPNIKFWKSMLSLIQNTNQTLKNHDLFIDEIKNKSERITELASFLLRISEKELNGEKITDSEYQTIEIIGSTVEYITISLLPNWVDNWSLVKGPDREVSVVADIYTANASNNPKKGVLHVGVGPVNDIYVVVEINGLLYLTRGATFSYYEFVEPMGTRLTDEEWQQSIKDQRLPAIPKWMEEIIYEKEAPKPDEKIFYSSGC